MRPARPALGALVAVAAVVAGCAPTQPSTAPTATTTIPASQPDVPWARVVRVVDGDTVDVRIHGADARVRMLGLDAPEMPSQCGAETATRDLSGKLPPETRVRLVSDDSQANKDRYGRLLRYIVKGGTDTSYWQIRRGNAEVLVVGQPFARLAEYQRAQQAAERDDLGIWGPC